MPLLVLFFAMSVFAQDPAPQWVEESWRSARYPNSEWYTGFARDKVNGQPDSKLYQAIEKEAQNKLSESIQIQIQSTAKAQTTSRQQAQAGNNFKESIHSNYSNSITTQANAVLAKVDSKSYFDKKTGYIYGFAAVNKKDLADFYKSRISSLFSYAEKELFIIEQLAETGKKSQALSKVRAIEDSLQNIGFWAYLLQSVVSDNSHAEQEKAFGLRVNSAKMLLQNGTAIYLDISGSSNYDFNEQLGAQMQNMKCNCTITAERENADYLVAVNIKLSPCSKNDYGEVYCYANATVTVDNPKYKKPVNVKIPEAKGGWTNGNTDRATEEAFKSITNSLAEKIVQTINQ